jgi:gamma-glutamyltranspeptidase / glutathione hydrolase
MARFPYKEARLQTFPGKFACPSVALRRADINGDINHGGSDNFQPWAESVAEG